MIASHYAEPVQLQLCTDAALMVSPNTQAPQIARLAKGEDFALLDETRGWAWGYGGSGRLVGYVESSALKRAAKDSQ